MDLIYFQLWLCYSVLLLLITRLTRDRFSPAIAFFATWSLSLGLLSLGSLHPDFQQPALPRSASFYLMLTGCCFFSGTIFAHALGPTARKRSARSQGEGRAEIRESFNLPGLKALALVALVFTVLYIYSEAPDLQSYLTSGRAIREQLTDASAGPASGLATIATYAALIVIPVAAIHWLRRRSIRWWMIIPILSLGVLALLSISKFLLIFLSLTFLNIALYQRAVNPASRVHRGPIFAVVAVIFCAFFVTTELRNRIDSGEGRAFRSGLAFTIYDYATGYVPAFGKYFEEYLDGAVTTSPINADYSADNRRPGNQTFSGIYRLLAQAGLVSQSASNRYQGAFNVYTIYRDFIIDFGIGGSLACTFLIGFSVTLFYRLSNRNKAGTVVLLALVTTQMEFSLMYSLFGFIFYPFLLLLSPLLTGSSGRHGSHRVSAIPVSADAITATSGCHSLTE